MTSDHISRVIFDYASKIGAARETGATLRLNADMARDLTGADRCSIWLIDAKSHQLWTTVAHGVPEIRIPAGQGIVGACITENKILVVNDTSADPRFLASASSGYVTRSLVTIPLHGSDGGVIGALQALNKPGGFAQEDVDLLGLAAAYSASVLETQRLHNEAEQARLMLKELEIARSVQERLFPQDPPVFPQLDYAVCCRPAKSVGGDFYDFIPAPDGGLLLTLGDVSGKGIAAAVMMASIQASIRSQVVRMPDSLAELMETFNQAVYSFSMVGKFATMFCGRFDRSMRKLKYVNAGQGPAMLFHAASGSVSRLNGSRCLPVGILPDAKYDQAEIGIETGDVLLSYSDGISEAVNERDEFRNEDDIERLFRSLVGETAERILQGVIEATDEFAGGAEQSDDMTVMVIKAV